MNRRLLFVLLILLLLGITAGSAAAQNSNSLWFCNYWTNPDLEGAPAASCSVGEINYDWGTGPPVNGFPSDHWSGEWTSYVDFSPGTYRFTTQNDDGVGVFLGDKHIVFDWNKHGTVTNVATVSLLGGSYSMAVQYFDDVSNAVLKVAWEQVGPPEPGAADVTVLSTASSHPSPAPPSGHWSASYWNNTDLSGNPSLTRNEEAINYDWGTGSPAPGTINTDRFSARWTRSVHFNAGNQRFVTQSDDGIRVFIDGNLIIDAWRIQELTTTTADVTLAAGTHAIVVEYFEDKGVAVAKFWWEGAGSGGPVGPTSVAATTTAYWLNFRTGPGTTYQIITALPKGTNVPVVGRTSTSRWIQVVNQGVTGWVSTYYTTVHGDLATVPVTG